MFDINFDEIDLTKQPPVEEPQRQYYFMAKARHYVQEKSRELGRDLTFCVTTFGCQMNARDSEKLVGVLEQIGYVEEPTRRRLISSSLIPVLSARTQTQGCMDVWGS